MTTNEAIRAVQLQWEVVIQFGVDFEFCSMANIFHAQKKQYSAVDKSTGKKTNCNMSIVSLITLTIVQHDFNSSVKNCLHQVICVVRRGKLKEYSFPLIWHCSIVILLT